MAIRGNLYQTFERELYCCTSWWWLCNPKIHHYKNVIWKFLPQFQKFKSLESCELWLKVYVCLTNSRFSLVLWQFIETNVGNLNTAVNGGWMEMCKHQKKYMTYIDNQQHIHSSKLRNVLFCQNQKVCTLIKQLYNEWHDDLLAEDCLLNNKRCQCRCST